MCIQKRIFHRRNTEKERMKNMFLLHIFLFKIRFCFKNKKVQFFFSSVRSFELRLSELTVTRLSKRLAREERGKGSRADVDWKRVG